MMNRSDAMMIASCFYDLLLDDDRLLKKIGKLWGTDMKRKPKLVSPNKAAEILGISVWQLYRIKDNANGIPRFSYIKTGNSNSSPLKFDASKILEEYELYLSERKSCG